MNSSERLFALIKECEGFKSTPYRCPAGIPTIGYGSTRYPDGRAVRLSDPPITEARAREILLSVIAGFERDVQTLVTVPLTQGQFDALVDFCYNVGSDIDADYIAEGLGDSKLLKKLNSGDYAGAAGEFGKWVYGGKKKLGGLIKRREAERKLFEEVCS